MENKTITYLNGKAWYRGLKVIYIFFVLVCYFIAILGIILHSYYVFDSQKEYTNEQTNKVQRLQEIQKMQDLGYTTKQITDNSIFKKGGVTTLSRDEFKKIYGADELTALDNISNPTTVSKQNPEKPTSYFWLILYIPLYLLIALGLSEIPKRIFYYVVLGSINPKK